jgi:quercetin dioxygenase-like cupin family protein
MKFESVTQDPIVTDGDKYSVVLENERVRVLRYHDKPGDRTLQHAHPDYVLYAVSSFKRRLTFPDGRKQEVDVKAGSVVWMKAHIHIGENVGDNGRIEGEQKLRQDGEESDITILKRPKKASSGHEEHLLPLMLRVRGTRDGR